MRRHGTGTTELRTLGHAKAIVALLAARKASGLEQLAALNVASELVHLRDCSGGELLTAELGSGSRHGARRRKRA
jgi:hypothetical protein